MRCLPAQQHMWDYYTDLGQAPRRAARAQRRARTSACAPRHPGRGVHAALPADHEGALVSGATVGGHRRAAAPLGRLDELAGFGVATVHEALGRVGYLGPDCGRSRTGARMGGSVVTALCWPGDNLMIHAAVEQCRPATCWWCHDLAVRGRAVRRAAGHLARRPRRARPGHRRRRARHGRAARDGLPGLVAAGQRAGHGEGDGRRGQRAGGRRRPDVHPGAVIIADDDGVLCVPRGEPGRALEASRGPARPRSRRPARPWPAASSAWTGTTCAPCWRPGRRVRHRRAVRLRERAGPCGRARR